MRSRELIPFTLITTSIIFLMACSETTSDASEVATVVSTKPVAVVQIATVLATFVIALFLDGFPI